MDQLLELVRASLKLSETPLLEDLLVDKDYQIMQVLLLKQTDKDKLHQQDQAVESVQDKELEELNLEMD